MFVGSSSEAEWLIAGLRLELEGKVDVIKWKTMAWPLSRDTLQGIEEGLDRADFAAFILAADDLAFIRGQAVDVPRDNVLFELGMSFGRLSRPRTFILAPSGARVPSDLSGITAVAYEPVDDARLAMAVPADKLFEAIGAVGTRDRLGSDGALERGDTSGLNVVADGALHVFESRYDYADQLSGAVLNGEAVPAKFQFVQAGGAGHWISLCKSPKYRYFVHAKAQLKKHKKRLAEQVREAAGSAAVDLVSLGSGDGSKDNILLRALADELAEREYLYYYPVDISDSLLVEAVRRVSRFGPDRRRFRCKPVLGDFTDLASLRGITAYRPNANLFSVLGNTIGTFDEHDILTSVEGAMLPDDLVLIEANIGDPEDSRDLLDDEAAYQWDRSTLDALEIRELCELRSEERTELSDVPGTRTLVSYAVPRDEGTPEFLLSAMHHYDFAKLQKYIKSELRVELIDAISGAGVGLLLGQRRSHAARGGIRRKSGNPTTRRG